ncbi:MAG: bifunctional adenosylcobinamide kinase/adenosylcobinamide-phosphate guanylyltransferase, partial [Acidimicrobiales bacterium]
PAMPGRTVVPSAGPGAALDPSWAERIAAHQERRPAHWSTAEVPPGGDLTSTLEGITGTVLVDSLGVWLAGCEAFRCDQDRLIGALRNRDGDTVIVSDEVGLGVHPSLEVGNLFRDALGYLNRAVADHADRVALVVAGRILDLSDRVAGLSPEHEAP